MFEAMVVRVDAAIQDRVRARIAALAERLREKLANDVEVETGPEGVILSARDLHRRLALDPRMRWTIGGRIDG